MDEDCQGVVGSMRLSYWIVLGMMAVPAIAGGARAATAVRGFPVQLEGTADVGPPLAADIDGDGKLELLVATRSHLHALEADGSPVDGYPVAFERGRGPATALAVGPLVAAADGADARTGIAFGTAAGELAVLGADAQPLAGFPLELKSPLAGPPSLVDGDGDGLAEIRFGTRAGSIYAMDAAGKPLPGYPARSADGVATAVTRARFTPGGPPVLLFGDDEGRLHAWSGSGRELDGFPYQARYTLASQPVLGDIDDDGSHEVVFGSKDYKIHVVESDGRAAAGFPVDTGYRIYAACALADVDGDGVVDVLAASGDGELYAVKAGGQALSGFPVAVGRRLRGSPVAGDLDLDGKLEIAVGSDRFRTALLRADGRDYPGFPARTAARVDVAPLLVDLTGNGLAEIVALSRDGRLYAWRMLKKGSGSSAPVWPTAAHDAGRSGVVAPNPPRYVELTLQPERPTTTDALELGYRFFDMDGDPEPQTRIRWWRDGEPVAALEGRRRVPAEQTRKHQRWKFTLQAAADAPVFTSPEVEVANTPPTAARVRIAPAEPRTGDDLRLEIAEEAEDVDGDRIRYRITWLRDRRPQKKLSGRRVPARRTAEDQRWTVVVVPFDGEVTGAPSRASAVVINTPPGPPRIALVPERPTVTQPVTAEIVEPGRDVDGDSVRHLFRWWAGERELNLPESAGRLPAGMAAKNVELRVEVTAFDGQERGGRVTARGQVVNTPPAAPTVRIEPAQPRTADDLLARVVAPAADPDREAIRYRFSWQRAGAPYRGPHAAAARLPAGETSKGERWTAVVTPRDSQADGAPGRVSVVVGNSPPQAPLIEQIEPRPPTDRDLELRLERPPRDPDGDAAWCRVVWSRDDRELARGKDRFTLPAARTVKHGRYRARITPTDGDDDGPTLERWFEVVNSPPGACRVAIAPQRPKSGQELTLRVVERPTDADGDRVRLRVRWFRDGRPIELDSDDRRVPGGRVQRGQRWRLLAEPFDGEQAGPACSAAVTVVNSPPLAPELALVPERPSAGDRLRLKVLRPASDPDGDPVALQVAWRLDDKPLTELDGPRALPQGGLRKGQHWSVEVRASDGELQSEPVRLEARVVNSSPARPALAIHPTEPLSSDDLHCRLTAATPDPDGDPVQHSYSWTLAGAEQPVVRRAELPAARTRKGQRWICRARASDGELQGPEARVEVRVGNAAPAAPEVVITPARPSADDELRCRIRKPAGDPDGDRVRYRFEWLRDGVVQQFAPETDRVPVRLTKPEDIWQCRVVASDGQLAGPAAESQEVLVLPAGS
jgi:hypothetical protein